jgi:hypothetical protein
MEHTFSGARQSAALLGGRLIPARFLRLIHGLPKKKQTISKNGFA